jgi:hypothetical protein
MVKSPGVLHLRMCSVVNAYPTVKNSRQNFQEKNDYQLGIVQVGAVEEFYFGYQPGE